MKRNKLNSVSDIDFISIIENSNSIREIILNLGYKNTGTYLYKMVNERLYSMGIIFETRYEKPDIKLIKDENIFIVNSKVRRKTLKKRILDNDLLEYKCSKCDLSEWLGDDISLHLDHINGINDDNRLENLRFMCPNCHSQTDTYCGRNSKKKYYCECGNFKGKLSDKCKECFDKSYTSEININQRKVKNRPPYDILISEIKEFGYSSVGRKYGVSDNAIRKWVKIYEKS